jgi:tetratricopeptide (TPR) repeat protein
MSVSYRAAVGTVFDDFRAEVGRQGFARAGQVYAAMKERNGDFRLEESAVERWGEELADEGHLTEAIELLDFNAHIFPESTAALTYLAEAYRLSGQKKLAIDSYLRALQKDPLNVDAMLQLTLLDTSRDAR